MFPFTVNALSATTAKTIIGTAPYLELNGVKAVDLTSLLSITVGGKKYTSDASGNMKDENGNAVSSAILLANAGDAFSTVGILVKADNQAYELSSASVIPTTARKDDDGDGDTNPYTIQGKLTATWKDKNGDVVTSLDASASICYAPYTLTLTTTGTPSISTVYGDPRETTYGNASAKYTLNPVSKITVCNAKPDKTYNESKYWGPASMWDTTKGFKVQSTKPATYGSNFPTTGADNLYFDLDIAGSTKALTWDTVTEKGITVTMSNISANKVTVTLTGPAASTTQKNSNTPTPVTKPSLPATIELIGKDGSTEVVKYGFVIQQWFINRGSAIAQQTGTPSQTSWCTSAGYLMPRVQDLTNASGTANGGGTIPLVANPSSGNYYQRRIGGGLFSEWGGMKMYTGGGWLDGYYWSSDIVAGNKFYVYNTHGMVGSGSASANGPYGLCRSN